MTGLDPYLPADFDAFWAETAAGALTAPLDYHRSGTADWPNPGFKVEAFTFRGISGEARHGWIAVPESVERAPGFLWIPPYGRWSMMPNEYGTREGMVSVSLNLHGESAFHAEDYTPSRGYFAEGIADHRTWVFRRIFQDCVLAWRILLELPEVEDRRAGAMGLSQGGGLAIWLAAHIPGVRAVVADLPFLGGMPWVFSHKVHRYPLKEILDFAGDDERRMAAAMSTLSYYDTLNQATRCGVPTLVALGLKDPAVKPAQVRAIHEALAGPKELVELDWGHDWHPSMVERNRSFLLAHV